MITSVIVTIAVLILLLCLNLFFLFPFMNEPSWVAMILGASGILVSILAGVKVIQSLIRKFANHN
mgnify:CR=1 FL=1